MMESPLSKASLADIRRAAGLAANAKAACERAASAGIDMTDAQVRCDHLQRSLQQLLDVYDQRTQTAKGTTNGG
jgi:hypothetical protein